MYNLSISFLCRFSIHLYKSENDDLEFQNIYTIFFHLTYFPRICLILQIIRYAMQCWSYCSTINHFKNCLQKLQGLIKPNLAWMVLV